MKPPAVPSRKYGEVPVSAMHLKVQDNQSDSEDDEDQGGIYEAIKPTKKRRNTPFPKTK